MIPVALLFLVASSRVELVNEVFDVPAGQWRYVQVALRQRPALVHADFEIRSGPSHVRLALMRRDDLQELREGHAVEFLAATAPGAAGRIRFRVQRAGDYVIVIDNREGEGQASQTHLQVRLDFDNQLGPEVTQLSPARQLAVIVISFAVFLGIVSYSARRLLRGIKP